MRRSERRSGRSWNVPLALGDVPEAGRHLDLVADSKTRAAVAEHAGLVALPRLEASFDVAPHGRGGLRVIGRVSATVGQTCVVTLEPLANEVHELVDLVFLPAAAVTPAADHEASAPIDAEAEDEPEVLVDGTIDLGAIAVEFLLLGVDPYPRKPGAVFEGPKAEDTGNHPFAALAALKRDKGADGD